MTPGVYHLLVYLPQETDVAVGRLGNFHFPAGYYVYTGSALSGLESRLSRHLRRRKRLHWHIDYLLQHGSIIDIITYQTTERVECKINQRILLLPDGEIPVKGFGSSDCSCISHLVYFPEKPAIFP